MSMYRQIWLAVIISTLLALAGSLLASSLSARNYLSEQLALKNSDNALALALSLSQRNPDAVEIELTVSALFDSGHYELIRVSDPFGEVIAERTAAPNESDVPAWFSRLLPINSVPGHAQISGGWKQLGTVTLVSHSRFAYRALWKSFWELAFALLSAGLVSGYLGTLILRRLRTPLDAVINQAEAITQRRFVTIDLPRVPELRQLAIAMNATVTRLKSMFDEEAARLETIRQEANCDPLTGLYNRSFFLARLQAALSDENQNGGSLLFMRVADLATINNQVGRAGTDELLRRIGKTLSQSIADSDISNAVAARMNGADFALLLPADVNITEFASSLLHALARDAEPYVGDAPIASIGMGTFPLGMDSTTVLSQVDAALADAEATEDNSACQTSFENHDNLPHSAGEWAQLLKQAIDSNWLKLVSFPVSNSSGNTIHLECPLRIKLYEQGEWLPAGQFLPIAKRLNLTSDLDLSAIQLGLLKLAADPHLPGVAVNLSASSLENKQFRESLQKLLREYNNELPRLWLEIAESGAFKHYDAFRNFCLEVKTLHCRIGLEHFGRQFSQIGLLHDLGLDYLKIDASFVRGLEDNPGNQSFLRGVCSIAHGIGLQVFAEGVANQPELNALYTLGFDGATGPAIR
ncbi:MAG: EAL domain-containing protein [Gallionella sp.]|nr:EAL domain-containing protein [Gallionella sp.]